MTQHLNTVNGALMTPDIIACARGSLHREAEKRKAVEAAVQRESGKFGNLARSVSQGTGATQAMRRIAARLGALASTFAPPPVDTGVRAPRIMKTKGNEA